MSFSRLEMEALVVQYSSSRLEHPLQMRIIPASTNCARQVIRVRDVSIGEISCRNLGVNLHLGIRRDQLVWDGNTFQNLGVH